MYLKNMTLNNSLELLPFTWPVPPSVGAAITVVGQNNGAFGGQNLALHVGDDPEAVNAKRSVLAKQLGVEHWQWLNQVHGTQVIEALQMPLPDADACFTRKAGIACAVLTADCLPVLFCDRQGTQVAAAHAGWRGLAAGVLGNTLSAFTRPSDVMAYLGPAIGPLAFEVGPEVKDQFEQALGTDASNYFTPSLQRPNHYFANLAALARMQLRHLGVGQVSGGDFCTYTSKQFYSYRRQAVTGRMASAIWLRAPA